MLSKLRSALCVLQHVDEALLRRAVSVPMLAGRLSSTAGPSPLQQLPTELKPDGTTAPVERASARGVARAVYRQLPISSKKLTPVAKLVRKMRVEDALLQCDLIHKKGSVIVQNAIRSARANGVHNHGLDATKLFVEQCFATNGSDLKRIKYHGKGQHGKMRRRRTHLTVILREDPSPRPRPHRIQETWMQRQLRREKGDVDPPEKKHRVTRVLSPRSKWKTQLRRMRMNLKLERQKAKRKLSQNRQSEKVTS